MPIKAEVIAIGLREVPEVEAIAAAAWVELELPLTLLEEAVVDGISTFRSLPSWRLGFAVMVAGGGLVRMVMVVEFFSCCLDQWRDDCQTSKNAGSNHNGGGINTNINTINNPTSNTTQRSNSPRSDTPSTNSPTLMSSSPSPHKHATASNLIVTIAPPPPTKHTIPPPHNPFQATPCAGNC